GDVGPVAVAVPPGGAGVRVNGRPRGAAAGLRDCGHLREWFSRAAPPCDGPDRGRGAPPEPGRVVDGTEARPQGPPAAVRLDHREIPARPGKPEIARVLMNVRLVLVEHPDQRTRHAVVDRNDEHEVS